jgi:hypothetical protein
MIWAEPTSFSPSPCIRGIPEGRKAPSLTSLFSSQVNPRTLSTTRSDRLEKKNNLDFRDEVTGVVGIGI